MSSKILFETERDAFVEIPDDIEVEIERPTSTIEIPLENVTAENYPSKVPNGLPNLNDYFEESDASSEDYESAEEEIDYSSPRILHGKKALKRALSTMRETAILEDSCEIKINGQEIEEQVDNRKPSFIANNNILNKKPFDPEEGLDPKYRALARQYFGEITQQNIEEMRSMVRQRSGKAPDTDRFYLKLLRAGGGPDVNSAMGVLELYYKHLQDCPQYFKYAIPGQTKYIFEGKMHAVLPHRDMHGRRVYVYRPGKWEPSKHP